MYALNADKAVSTIRMQDKEILFTCLFMGSGLIEAIKCIMVSLYRKRTVKYISARLRFQFALLYKKSAALMPENGSFMMFKL